MKKEPKQQRVPLMMEASLLAKIDTFRFSNRIATRAEAMRLLMNEALETKTATSEVPAS